MGCYTVIYKIHFAEGKLEELQRVQTDFSAKEAASNCMAWSVDNGAFAVGGEDRVVRLYKFKGPTDFKTPVELRCSFAGGHHEPINSVAISQSKTLLVSAGNDASATVWDVRTQTQIQKLTFRDKLCRDARGNPDASNFLVRGCSFSACGRYLHLLTSKIRYKSFLVKYRIVPQPGGKVGFMPVEALEVHNQAATGMLVSPDGGYVSVTTSDGCIRTVETSTNKVVIGQKRHNLPCTATGFVVPGIDQAPTHVVTGSADYTYNLIKVPGSTSFIVSGFKHLAQLLLFQLPAFFLLLLLVAGYF